MSTFIREVDEGLRQDRMLGLWRRWRWVAAGTIVLFLGAVWGWQLLNAQRDSARENSTLAYALALDLSDNAYETWLEVREAAATAELEAAEAAAELEAAELEAAAELAAAELAAESADSESEADLVELDTTALEAAVAASIESAEPAPAPEPVRLSDAELREQLGFPVYFYDEPALGGLNLTANEDSTAGVRVMAGLQLAWRHIESGRPDKADAAWRAIVADSELPSLYRDFASVVAAQSMLGRVPGREVAELLRPAADNEDSPFWASAAEMTALAEIDAGDIFAARGRLERLSDPDNTAVPFTMKRRANSLLVSLDSRAPQADPDPDPDAETDPETDAETAATDSDADDAESAGEAEAP